MMARSLSRRGLVAGLVAAPLASGIPAPIPSGHEAEFVALAPRLVPMLDEYDRLWAVVPPFYAAVELVFPNWHRFHERDRSPEWRAYLDARAPADALEECIMPMIEPFIDHRMTSFDAILLRHRTGRSFSQFRELALDDLDELWGVRPCA